MDKTKSDAKQVKARLAKIVGTLTRHNVLSSLAEQKHPERVREAFEELGPSFIKIGQILSTRSDIITPEFGEELKKLQNQVKTDSYEDVSATVLDETGHPVEDLFEEFSQKPLASASIAQVHTAVLKGGQAVVVKVQHPGIFDEMSMDIALLEKAVPLVKFIPASGMGDPAAIVAELKRSLLNELDFTKEAENIEKFGNFHADVPYILSPKVYREFSSERLLIMDFMQGVPVSAYVEQSNTEAENGNTAVLETKKRLAKEIVDNYMKQIFDNGFFHADPHPGNILITLDGGDVPAEEMDEDGRPKEAETLKNSALEEFPLDIDVTVAGVSLSTVFHHQNVAGLFAGTANTQPTEYGPERIVFIDFGMMGTLDERTLEKLNHLLAAAFEKDNDKMARAILNLCKVKAPVDMGAFTKDVGAMFENYYEMSIGDLSIPDVFDDINTICIRYKLQLPEQITLLVKGVGTIEGVVLSLDPNLSIMSAVLPYAKRYLQSQFDPKAEVVKILKDLYRAGKAMPEIPVKISRVLDTLSRGEMKLSMETGNLDELFKRMETMVNRLVMGIIVAALIMGSSLLIHFADTAKTVVSGIGTAGFVLAFILVIILVIQTYRRRK